MPGGSLRESVDSLAHDARGTAVDAVLARWSAPFTVGVSGRPGVGKSRVLACLDPPAAEVHGVDSPDHPWPDLDHDVLVHVLVRAVYPADRRVLAARNASGTVVVVNRVDLLPDPTAFAREMSDVLGLPVLIDADEVSSRVDEMIARRRRARDVTLLGDLETVGAADERVRPAIERFLRCDAAADVRRLWRRR